jgi:hypothetical protein
MTITETQTLASAHTDKLVPTQDRRHMTVTNPIALRQLLGLLSERLVEEYDREAQREVVQKIMDAAAMFLVVTSRENRDG